MDDALNSRTRQRVRAEEIAQRRGWHAQDFECPGCHHPVRLRRGRWRAAHFAHVPGYDTEGCSYYHGGTGGGGGGWSVSEPEPLPLYVEIRTAAAGETVWTLYLSVPRTESRHGQITVRDGITGRARISCATLSNGGRRVPVKPQESDYIVEVTPDVDDSDAARLTVGSPGLDSDAPTLFRAGLGGGRRLFDDYDLVWGEPYFAVWHADKRPAFPQKVEHQELASLGREFRGGVFQLPLDADEQVRHWIANSLYRRVTSPGVSLSVISPLALPGSDDGFRVDARQEVVVAVCSPGGTRRLSVLTVLNEETRILYRLPLKSGAPTLLVSLGNLGQKRLTVSAENGDGDVEAELSILGYLPPRVTITGVELIEIDANDSAARRVIPLHTRAASHLLRRARDGEARLDDVRLPPWVSCTLSVAGDVQAVPVVTNPEYRLELVGHIQKLLTAGQAFELDAGSFGRTAVAARRQAHTPTARVNALTTDWRRRIQAVTTLAVHQRTDTTASLEPQLVTRLALATTRLSALDGSLLGNFTRLRWPTGVLPQARTLATQLICYFSRTSQRSDATRE